MVLTRLRRVKPDPTTWSDEEGIQYDALYPSRSWQTLDLPDVGDMFHTRVLRTGSVRAPVPIP